MGGFFRMRRSIVFFAFLLLFFIAIPVSSAADEDSYVDVYNVNHEYEGNHANFYIDGYVEGYSSMGDTPDGDVKLRIVGKNYTKESTQYTTGDYSFNVPVNPGNYSYSVTYLGNWVFNPSRSTGTYYIPKKSASLGVHTKLGVKKLTVTTELFDHDDLTPIVGVIQTKLGTKTYTTKTNSNGITTVSIPAVAGKQKLSISFLGSGLYNGKSNTQYFSISSYAVVASYTTSKFIRYTENGNYLCKQYINTAKKYYFNGLIKSGSSYYYMPVNYVKTANFGSGSSSQIVKTYPDGYLEVDKYSYLKEIGIYDYISYDNRYLDYFKICYSNGNTKTVPCSHYVSDYWTISSAGVSKIKFYFYC
jgi:hypothetical protein